MPVKFIQAVLMFAAIVVMVSINCSLNGNSVYHLVLFHSHGWITLALLELASAAVYRPVMPHITSASRALAGLAPVSRQMKFRLQLGYLYKPVLLESSS